METGANTTHAITKQELIEVMNTYVEPVYHLIGGMCAIAVCAGAIILIIKPLIKRIS